MFSTLPFVHPGHEAAAPLRLRLLATTDLHAHLMPWNYATDSFASLGLAQLAPLIRQLRSEARNCLLLDNGDFLQGSPLGDRPHHGRDRPHPMIAAMNALGYDAGTLGNHEFSHGLAFVEAALAQARFPIVSANLRRRDSRPLVPAHTVITLDATDDAGKSHPLRIAITGFAPPQTVQWEALHLDGALLAEDILTAADRTLARIAEDRPDLTIALAHTGISEALPLSSTENAAIPLAARRRIDVLVTGHTHLVFPDGQTRDPDHPANGIAGTLHGKPAVMAGFHGSHLGLIDLELWREQQGWRIIAHRATVLPAPVIPAPDAGLARLARPAHKATLARMRRPLGHTLRSLHSHFALIAPCATLRLIAEAQHAHWIDRIPPDLSHLPLLSAVAPFRTGGRGGPQNFVRLQPGPVLVRHVAHLYAHPNTPVLLALSGAEIADWLERAAIIFHRISPDATDATLIRPDIPGFDFDVIHGLSFRIDLSRPPRFDAKGTLVDPQSRRITGLALDGLPLDPQGRFLVATNSYRAGSAIYPGTARPPVARSDTQMPDLLARHITTCGPLDIDPGRAWDFLPLPGASVLLDTGPEAAHHLADIARFRPEPLGETASGFLRFRLSL